MDPRLSRSNSMSSETPKPPSPGRVDPRLRTQPEQPQQQHHWPHPMAQMPQTHYTIGDGLTTYQHLVPSATAAAPAMYPAPYTQYPGYGAYQTSAYGHHPAYAAYYTPAPPPQHIDQNYQQQAPQIAAQPVAQAAQAAVPPTYAPQGAPQGSWAPARMSEQLPVQVPTPITAYMQQQQPHQQLQAATMPPSPDITSTSKQEGVEQEMQQSQAEMRRQRDDFEVRAAALNRELDQLKRQKRELKQQLSDNSADRQTATILKDNAKLQAEIQSKVKEFASMADILSGILGDRKKSSKERGSKRRHRSRERSTTEHRSGRNRTDRSSRDKSAGAESSSSNNSSPSPSPNNNNNKAAAPTATTIQHQQYQHQLPDLTATIHYNYVHYDPEVHWCRICDAFPRTAKDLLQHLHDDDHRQLMQAENIEIPWHKLPSKDKEFPFRDGAVKRRVPIKGLQFFVSAPAWYCRLCDVWIGDLHCASQHLKSIGHSQNYANFVDQNPQWENDWMDDRKKAFERVSKTLLKEGKVNSAIELSGIEKKAKTLASISSMHLENKKKHKKSSKKNKKGKSASKNTSKGKKYNTDTSSSTTSSSDEDDDDDDDSSSDNGVDKTKSIRVAMRNQVMKSSSAMMDEQIMILENLVKEKKRLQQQELEMKSDMHSAKSAAASNNDNLIVSNTTDDRLIAQWMNLDSSGNSTNPQSASAEEKNKDKYLLDSLKDRLKQKQDREERARQLLQLQQQQRELQVDRETEEAQLVLQKREADEKERRDREMEGAGIMNTSREQVKFRQFRGGKATAAQRRRSSNDASSPPPPPTKIMTASPSRNLTRSSRRSRSRSRSSSTERRRSSRDYRDNRRDRDRDRRYTRGGRKGGSRSRSRSNSKTKSNNAKIIESTEKEKKQQQQQLLQVVVPKKLPFIGRMPLFKNRKLAEEQLKSVTNKPNSATTDSSIGESSNNAAAVAQDSYEMPRQSRFQPGNLARAFIPQPDVVHYPKLTTQPAPVLAAVPPVLPQPPRISVPRAPPPPKIQPTEEEQTIVVPVQEQQVYEYTEAEFAPCSVSEQQQQLEHLMLPPLPPPPPPPKLNFLLGGGAASHSIEDVDDLAMLGISSDDMAAQVF